MKDMNSELTHRYQYLTKLLDIQYPIFQGGMGNISEHTLAAAVSNAGGLGTIAAGGLSPEQLVNEISEVRELTDKPFAVNVPLKNKYANEFIQVVINQKVPVLVTGAGSPEIYLSDVKKAGIHIIPVVSFCALAKRLARLGVDAVIAEGCESGGHIGETTTMCLVPQIVDTISIPVIAAGGIADGRGVAASFMLGASGFQMGTAFLAAAECQVSDHYRDMVFKARDTSTVVLNHGKVDLDDIRVLKSPLTTEYLATEADAPINLEGRLALAAKKGDAESGLYMAGQIAGMIKEKTTVKDLLASVWNQACACMGA